MVALVLAQAVAPTPETSAVFCCFLLCNANFAGASQYSTAAYLLHNGGLLYLPNSKEVTQ